MSAANRSEASIDREDLIAGLGRGLSVIEAFDDENAQMTAAQVAERTGISRTAARRYLLSLCHFGYARNDGKRFWLEPRVLRLGQSYLLSARLPRLAQPFLERLAAMTGETASLGVLDGHDVIYLVRHGGARLTVAGFQIGARVPAHVVSVGRAILGSFSDDELDRWLREHRFASFTRFTELDARRFRGEILQARKAGYAVSDQQLELGWRGVAVPLRNRHGECLGALSVTLPAEPAKPVDLVQQILPPLREIESGLRGLL